MSDSNIGKVVQVIGPVLDVEFDPEGLPEIYNALALKATAASGQEIDLVAEVQQHIGRGQVRAVSMSSTDGVARGMDVVDTGSAITVPVGEVALGRILNVLGEPVDEAGPVGNGGEVTRWPIHRPAPKFDELEPKTEIFETGIKVVDLLAPYVKGGQDRLVRRRRRGQDRHHHGAHQQHRHGARGTYPCSAAWASALARGTTFGSR